MACPWHAGGDEPKKSTEEKKPEPPRILIALPPAISAGQTNLVELRGLNLTNITELRVAHLPMNRPARPSLPDSGEKAAERPDERVSASVPGFNERPTARGTLTPPGLDAPGITSLISTSGPVEVPKDYDGKRIGDTRVRAVLAAPAAAAGAGGSVTTNWLIAISPAGASEPFPMLLLPGGVAVVEAEPNGGFQQAQALEPGRCVIGTIQESGDVDVFRVRVQAGQELVAGIHAAPGGSMLDALVTIVDDAGTLLAANDDADGAKDSRVRWKATRAGALAVVVQDANDKGGVMHTYLLQVLVR